MARKRDVVKQAFRRLNVCAHDEDPTGPQELVGLDYLAQVFADLNGSWGGCTLAFTITDEFPDAYIFPMADLLAARLAPVFQRPAPMAETTALMRVRAVNVPYVRDMDLNDDDETEEDEIEAVDRSRYY